MSAKVQSESWQLRSERCIPLQENRAALRRTRRGTMSNFTLSKEPLLDDSHGFLCRSIKGFLVESPGCVPDKSLKLVEP